MKSDLDALMAAHDLDALLVSGPAQNNPPMVYLTGGAHLTRAVLVKKRGQEPVLFHLAMERDEAAQTGLQTHDLGNSPLASIMAENGLNRREAEARLSARLLDQAGVSAGRVAVSGLIDSGQALAVYSKLQAARPELEIVGELEDESVLRQARATKDSGEVARIQRMGQITVGVVARTAEFLSGHQARGGVLVRGDGESLTIGDVKKRINLWLAEEGVDNPHGSIFAIGGDAGVPHSSGNPADPLKLGQTIIFDIYPCEPGGGYFYDFTRTWCLGHAPDEALALYEDVRAVYKQIMAELKPGLGGTALQERTCALFEARGHATIQSDPQTRTGYVHGLGHGLGLEVHELPTLSSRSTEQDRLDPGVVVTIEPGLYYPQRGMGVRLEDTVAVHPDGRMEILADYPLDLVIPIRT